MSSQRKVRVEPNIYKINNLFYAYCCIGGRNTNSKGVRTLEDARQCLTEMKQRQRAAAETPAPTNQCRRTFVDKNGVTKRAPVRRAKKPILGHACVNNLVQRAIGNVLQLAASRVRARQWSDDNPERVREQGAATYSRNKQKIIDSATDWNKRNRERRNLRLRPWATNYMKERKAKDPAFHLRCKLRSRMYHFMKRTKSTATQVTSELLGCTYDELHQHLALMVDGEDAAEASAVDHIFPMVAYNPEQPSTHKKMCNYTNLQPLTPTENGSKADKLPTKAMAARVDRSCWPDGVTEDMLPDVYPGWSTPLRM